MSTKKYRLYYDNAAQSTLAIAPEYDYPGRQANDCFIRVIADEDCLPERNYLSTKPMTLTAARTWLEEQETALVGDDIKRCLGLSMGIGDTHCIVPFDSPLVY